MYKIYLHYYRYIASIICLLLLSNSDNIHLCAQSDSSSIIADRRTEIIDFNKLHQYNLDETSHYINENPLSFTELMHSVGNGNDTLSYFARNYLLNLECAACVDRAIENLSEARYVELPYLLAFLHNNAVGLQPIISDHERVIKDAIIFFIKSSPPDRHALNSFLTYKHIVPLFFELYSDLEMQLISARNQEQMGNLLLNAATIAAGATMASSFSNPDWLVASVQGVSDYFTITDALRNLTTDALDEYYSEPELKKWYHALIRRYGNLSPKLQNEYCQPMIELLVPLHANYGVDYAKYSFAELVSPERNEIILNKSSVRNMDMINFPFENMLINSIAKQGVKSLPYAYTGFGRSDYLEMISNLILSRLEGESLNEALLGKLDTANDKLAIAIINRLVELDCIKCKDQLSQIATDADSREVRWAAYEALSNL